MQRDAMRSLRWRPFSLTEQTVSSNRDLLQLLETVLQLQARSGRQLPLLVDENIHYRILRLLYSAPALRFRMGEHLANVPLLYGIWHAYKHTVTVVYRAFFPVLAHLEVPVGAGGSRQLTTSLRSHRKVLYMEKLFASLLLTRADVLPQPG
eukprot:EG_transcript_22263